jgi:hypothetical protein
MGKDRRVALVTWSIHVVAKSAYYLGHIRLPVSAAPTGRISVKFDIGHLQKYVEKIEI